MKLALLMIGFAALAFADSPGSPLPSAYTGVDYMVMQGFVTPVCIPIGCGGEFYGTVQNGSNPTFTTNLWCIDSQEDFNFGDQGYADVVSLTNLNSNPSSVRFSGVSDSAYPTWTDTDASLPSGYVGRYDMVAYLASQFTGIGSDPSHPTIVDDSAGEAIERAIWVLTNNNSVGAGDYEPNFGGPASNGTGSVAYWIQKALSNYSTFAANSGNSWAIVSWQSNASGSLSGQPNQQTFLAQLVGAPGGNEGPNGPGSPTPEPGFYIALGVGLSALFAASQLKKRA